MDIPSELWPIILADETAAIACLETCHALHDVAIESLQSCPPPAMFSCDGTTRKSMPPLYFVQVTLAVTRQDALKFREAYHLARRHGHERAIREAFIAVGGTSSMLERRLCGVEHSLYVKKNTDRLNRKRLEIAEKQRREAAEEKRKLEAAEERRKKKAAANAALREAKRILWEADRPRREDEAKEQLRRIAAADEARRAAAEAVRKRQEAEARAAEEKRLEAERLWEADRPRREAEQRRSYEALRAEADRLHVRKLPASEMDALCRELAAANHEPDRLYTAIKSRLCRSHDRRCTRVDEADRRCRSRWPEGATIRVCEGCLEEMPPFLPS